jgi:hypothetical protein
MNKYFNGIFIFLLLWFVQFESKAQKTFGLDTLTATDEILGIVDSSLEFSTSTQRDYLDQRTDTSFINRNTRSVFLINFSIETSRIPDSTVTIITAYKNGTAHQTFSMPYSDTLNTGSFLIELAQYDSLALKAKYKQFGSSGTEAITDTIRNFQLRILKFP